MRTHQKPFPMHLGYCLRLATELFQTAAQNDEKYWAVVALETACSTTFGVCNVFWLPVWWTRLITFIISAHKIFDLKFFKWDSRKYLSTSIYLSSSLLSLGLFVAFTWRIFSTTWLGTIFPFKAVLSSYLCEFIAKTLRSFCLKNLFDQMTWNYILFWSSTSFQFFCNSWPVNKNRWFICIFPDI